MNTSTPIWAIVAMAVVVGASNYLVQIPVADVQLPGSGRVIPFSQWLTWGAMTYPVAFLVNDLVNRFYGPASARRVVLVGFAVGVALSLAAESIETRIAVASGTAFLLAQLLDVFVFDRLRQRTWWVAPSASSAISTVVDTALFFSIAFAGTGLPWVQWATGDLAVKWVVAFFSVLLFGAIARRYAATRSPPALQKN